MVKTEESLVYLEPIEHVYIHRETGTKYSSVTKAIASVEPHFDADAVAEAITHQLDTVKQERYIGLSKQQILDFWQMLNDEANTYGTYVHDTVETYLKKNKWWFPTDELQQKVIQGYDNLKVDEGICIQPERIMFSEEHKLAGMSDLIVDINDKFFDVGDWKGLPLDTPIFTNTGWKTMGTLVEGDKVYDMDGKLVDILHLSQVKNKPCYKIKFDNGEEIIADFEHRWLISFYRDRKFKDVVMTTIELFNYLMELNSSGKRWSHKLPKIRISKPLDMPKVELPLDPYVFGIWLGDGHSVDSKVTNMHDDIWAEIEKRGYKIGQDISGGGAGKAETRTLFGVRDILRGMGVLENEHIPSIYLNSSYEQRLDLLRGFMDADGHYNKKRKRFVMSTTREWQRDAFVQLISSLGLKGSQFSSVKKFNGKDIIVYDICFSTNTFNPFLRRNQDIEPQARNNNAFKNIVSVEPVASVPTRCIEVNSESHTFLYGFTFSITHNTNRLFNYYNIYGYETLKKPFDHLQNCQWSIYTLQLSVYAYMYELETGKKCRQIWIGYWDKTVEYFQRIQVMYLKKEAKQLLDLHKYNMEFK